MLRRPLSLLLVLVMISIGAGCGSPAEEEAGAEDRLEVVATFSILGDLVANVGGEEIGLTTLVGPDGDAHTYEPAPADAVVLAEADLVFENGLGFEVWLDDLYESSGSTAKRVVVTEGIEPGVLVEDGVEEPDPHVWQDVANATVMVGQIRDALTEADPESARAYQANADSYLAELEELDGHLERRVGMLSPDQRKLVTNHDAFGYFVRRYGFELVGTAISSFSTEAADPSAAEIAVLVDEIRATGVRAIFPENVENERLIEQIARDAGVAIGPPLYSDALGPPGSPGASYVGMMRHNVDAIVGALGG